MAKNDKKKEKKKPKKPQKGNATTQGGSGDQPPVGPKP
jgi:hypothetical protein